MKLSTQSMSFGAHSSWLAKLKPLVFVAALSLAQPSAWAFALVGPTAMYTPLPAAFGDSWEVPDIGYDPLPVGTALFPDSGNGTATGPKNLGEEYRRNTPIVYYSCDLNFRQYFGTTGVRSIELAFKAFNAITNVSQYSANLSELPNSTRRENYQALNLSLMDLRTFLMRLLTEQVGLTEPERYIWTIRQRNHSGTVACPAGMTYLLIHRNYDPVASALDQYQTSLYVNGALYTFYIAEDCGASPPAPPTADAIEYPVDPLADAFTAVASGNSSSFVVGVQPGMFFNGLTRDDVGGLRYLLSTNNLNIEGAGAGTEAFITNTATPQILVTSNLNTFLSQALTNNAATLQGLYPGLVITASSNWFGLGVTTNISAALVFRPQDPYGTPPSLVLVTNYTTNVVQYFQHTFLNVVTNSYSPYGLVTRQTITATVPPDSPVGTPATFTTNSVTVVANMPTGDFYIVPTNLCGVDVITNLLPTAITETVTNTFVATNTLATTNGTTVITNLSGEVDIITYYTNHTIVFYPISCPTNPIAQFQGIDRVRFVHVDDDQLDSLTGFYRTPLTNDYTLYAFDPTNHNLVPYRIRRVITRPDIEIGALDMGGPAVTEGGITYTVSGTSLPFAYYGTLPGLAGPGTIDDTGATNTFITFNKVGPTYFVQSPYAYFLQLAQSNSLPFFLWGSFDGTTNPPVVYPNGTSVENLVNQMFIQLAPPPPTLPPGTNGVAYSVQMSATGGEPPYTWSLATNSPALPGSLTLDSDGLISGTPTTPGTYDFVIQLSDSGSRVVNWNYSVTIYQQ